MERGYRGCGFGVTDHLKKIFRRLLFILDIYIKTGMGLFKVSFALRMGGEIRVKRFQRLGREGGVL